MHCRGSPAPNRRPNCSRGAQNSTHPDNFACNSPTPLSIVETRTLIFCGFQGMLQNTLQGITCEIWGGPATGSAGSTGSTGAPTRSPTGHAVCAKPQTHCVKNTENRSFRANGSALWRDFRWEPSAPARNDCQHHLGDRRFASGYVMNTRIGYEDPDRLLSYPDPRNLSGS